MCFSSSTFGSCIPRVADSLEHSLEIVKSPPKMIPECWRPPCLKQCKLRVTPKPENIFQTAWYRFSKKAQRVSGAQDQWPKCFSRTGRRCPGNLLRNKTNGEKVRLFQVLWLLQLKKVTLFRAKELNYSSRKQIRMLVAASTPAKKEQITYSYCHMSSVG